MKTGNQADKSACFRPNIDDSMQYHLLLNTVRLPHRMVHVIEEPYSQPAVLSDPDGHPVMAMISGTGAGTCVIKTLIRF